MNNEFKKKLAHEALIVLGVIIFLTFITQLWPLALLALVGIMVAVVRYMYVSRKIELTKLLLPASEKETTCASVQPEISEQGLLHIAFGIFQKRVTKELLSIYPEARWLWDSVHPFTQFRYGGRIMLRLNRAGGYRKAWAVVHNLQFVVLDFEDEGNAADGPEEKATATGTKPSTSKTSDKAEPSDSQINYELLAFEWISGNMHEIDDLFDEALANNQPSFLIPADILPTSASWPCLCTQIDHRREFGAASVCESGIEIKTELNSGKEIIS